jgi:tight adherence protein B
MRAASFIVIAALLLAAPASAANSPRLTGLDVSGYPTVKVSVVTPTPSSSAPRVRENGEPVVGVKAQNLARAKSVELAIDISRSMEGTAFANAVAAARSFVASKSPADRIAVIGFGRRALRLTGFSSSTIDADAALGSLAVDGKQGTALYDAVALGSRSLAAEPLPGRVLIVLTDGDDTTSRATLQRAAREARNAGVTVYTIGIEGEGFSPAALQELARESGGAYFPAASSAAIDAAYRSIAEQLRRTWRITYLSSATPGETVRLEASVRGFGTGSIQARLPGNVSDTVVEPNGPWKLVPAFVYDHNLGTLFLALLVGACAILAVGLLTATPGGTRLKRRLEPHTSATNKRRARQTPRERFAAASGMLSSTEKWLQHLKFWAALHRLIERADLPLRTVEFFYICIGSGFVLALIAAAAGLAPILILGVLAAGVFAPVGFVTFKAKQRLNQIEEQLPDILITIAASLKAGHSFRQGLQAVVEEGQPPAADEFKRVLTETSLGRPMDDALAEMSERVGSKNLEFVITAVTIQRQVGGSLAGIFDMVADSVRQRQQFMRKIKGLTAMGRMAAYVLVGLPFFLGFVFTLLNPTYMEPLWHSSAGHKVVLVGLAMMAVGSLILRKMVSFRG